MYCRDCALFTNIVECRESRDKNCAASQRRGHLVYGYVLSFNSLDEASVLLLDENGALSVS